tara:strand:- start:534 stop:947 length:414 start_codon:yes stop_codon:yes gene_type:complete
LRADVIIEHEHWQRESYHVFIRAHYSQAGFGLPSSDVQGAVEAQVNQGRWVACCPAPGCGEATCISSITPLFVCSVCGSLENDGKWYAVILPDRKEQIEAELLKRPARDGWRAVNRNWQPGETVAQLQADNELHGVA